MSAEAAPPGAPPPPTGASPPQGPSRGLRVAFALAARIAIVYYYDVKYLPPALEIGAQALSWLVFSLLLAVPTLAIVGYRWLRRRNPALHRRLLTFLFDDTSVSRVHYQITQETCAYFQGDFWGLLTANYLPGDVTDAAQIRAAFGEDGN